MKNYSSVVLMTIQLFLLNLFRVNLRSKLVHLRDEKAQISYSFLSVQWLTKGGGGGYTLRGLDGRTNFSKSTVSQLGTSYPLHSL